MPRVLGDQLLEKSPLLHADDTVDNAVRAVIDTDLPALPVVDRNERLVGIFGEREFIGALFPAYLKELGYAGFVPKSVDSVIEKRQSCRLEPVSRHMNTEHIDVPTDFSEVQLAEIFLHHRVLIVPVVDGDRVIGVVTRTAFFTALAQRFISE